jgi:hypothetical protein
MKLARSVIDDCRVTFQTVAALTIIIDGHNMFIVGNCDIWSVRNYSIYFESN